MTLEDRDLTILRYLAPGRTTLKPLFQDIPKTAVYARLRKLTEAGMVFKEGKRRGLLPAGRDALAARKTVAHASIADLPIPHLDLAPTPVHRAVLTLVAAAIVARQHRMSDSHHPSFVLVGPKLTWKSWLAKLACLLAGIDPREFVLNMGLETPGSLIQRRGGTGKVVSRREAISQPVIGLDEFGRAKSEVLRIAKTILYGDLLTPFENETLEIRCVPMVMMNPRKARKDADLGEILGLDEGTVRRSVIADLAPVEIPQDILTDGDDRLDRARAMGKASFPAPSHPDWRPSEEVKAILLAAFEDPGRLADVDVSMVALLCTAMTAWLSREDALLLGTTRYLEVMETQGGLKSEWRSALPVVATAPSRPSSAATVARDADKPNPFDLATKARVVLRECRKAEMSPRDAGKWLAWLRKVGLRRVRRLGILSRTLTDAAIEIEDVEASIRVSGTLGEAMGLPRNRAFRVLAVLPKLIRQALPDRAGPRLRAALRALTRGSADHQDLTAKNAALREKIRDMEASRQRLNQENRRLRQLLEDLEERIKEEGMALEKARRTTARAQDLARDADDRLQELRSRCDERESAWRAMQSDVDLVREQVDLLAGEIRLEGPFMREVMIAITDRQRRGLSLKPPLRLSDGAKRELLEHYRRALDGDLVARWETDALKRDARREAAGQLRDQLLDVLRVLQDPSIGIEEKQQHILQALPKIF